jgi:proteasome lid subunit RPN8/RPN11
MSFRLQLPRKLREEMIAHAKSEVPNECVGLLAGVVEGGMGVVKARYPLVNAAASPVEFLSQPESMFAAYRSMHAHGLDILAIYHSHPISAPIPSRTDLARNYSPDVLNFIISLQSESALMRAWWLKEDSYRELDWYWLIDD